MEERWEATPAPNQVRGSERGGRVPSPGSPDGSGERWACPGQSCSFHPRQDLLREKPSKAERGEGSIPFLPCSHLPVSSQAPRWLADLGPSRPVDCSSSATQRRAREG